MNAGIIDSRNDWVELNHISHQSSHGGDCASGSSVSCLSYGGGGETGFLDKSDVVNDNSSKIHVACRGESSPLKTEFIVLCTIRSLISCKTVCCRKIHIWSYVSGNFRDNGTLISSEDDNSIVGSAGRSIEISTRSSSTSVGQGVSCNGTDSAATSDSSSSRASGSTITESASTFAVKGSVIGCSQAQVLAQHWALCNLVQMN